MIKKISNEEYHSCEGLSKSMMDKINESPAHFKYSQENKEEQTEAMLIGSLFHTVLLEPELLDKEYAVLPDIDRRTSAGKAQYAEFAEANEGKQFITQKQIDLVNEWKNAIMNHPQAKNLFKPNEGENEVSIFWTDRQTGELCKARPDRIVNNCIIDLKSTTSSQQDDFQRKAYDLGYYRQAAWFKEAYEQEFNKPLDKFIFVAVEKTPPYNVVVYVIDDFAIEIGERDNRRLLETYHHCKETGNWYGYDGEDPKEQVLGLPNWVIAKNMEEM